MAEHIEVRTRFSGEWVDGFEVAGREARDGGRVRVRRRSDGIELPTTFAPDEVRPTRSSGPRRGPRTGPR